MYSSNFTDFTEKMRLGRIGRGQFVHPLPEGRTCSSRSCFILGRWLSNVSLKFLSHRDLLTCFEVSLVESQLNLLQWSYFARVPLAIRISFLACFRFFLYACFLHVFLFYFPLSCSSPDLKCDFSTSAFSQFVSGL